MGSLYIKDNETNRLAEELAVQRGVTKTAAVKLAIANELKKGTVTSSIHEIAAELRRTSKLTFDPSIVIDKAFYDSLNDEDDD